jgi:hypothetical protein
MRKTTFANDAAELEHYRLEDRKRRARLALMRAIRERRVVRPDRCSRCFSMATPEAHHPNGYENPLDVVWLCTICHNATHHPNSESARRAELAVLPPEERPHHLDLEIWKRVLMRERRARRMAAKQ